MSAGEWNVVMAFAISLAVCAGLSFLSPKDKPDGGRKDHKKPIATLGGLGMAAGYYTIWVKDFVFGTSGLGADGSWLDASDQARLVFPGFAAVFLVLGAVDDVFSLGPKLKLILMLVTSIAACCAGYIYFTGGPWPAQFGGVSIVLIAGGALWLFVVVNATNFMDGSNGLALGSAAIMLAVLGIIAGETTTLLVAVIVGFLVWNLSNRLFAGDAGALFIGFFVAAIGLYCVRVGVYSIWIPPLIALPFLADIILTVIWRARRGGNILQAHNVHAYQLFRRSGWGHIQTALLWWAMSALCGLLAIWAAHQAHTVQFASFAGATIIMSALWLVQRRVYWPKVEAAS